MAAGVWPAANANRRADASAAGLAQLASAAVTTLQPADPVVFVATALFTVVVGLAAVAVPAWKALRVDPLVALRAQ